MQPAQARRSRKHGGRWSVLVLLLIIASVGCRKDEPQAKPAVAPQEASLELIRAETVKVDARSWPTLARAQGSLVADEVAVIGAKVSGRIQSAEVDLGDRVEPGTILAVIDPTEFRVQLEHASAQLLQARSAVGLKEGDPLAKLDPQNAPPVREARAVWEEAKKRIERWQQLHAEEAVAQEEYDQVLAAERVAEARFASAVNSVNEKIATIHIRMAELQLAQDNLRETTILAPFAGVVQTRWIAPGSYVQVGAPILTLVRIDPLRFQGSVPERLAQSIAVGQSVTLTLESIDQPRTATVTRISPTLDPLSRALTFEAAVTNADGVLRAGLFAEAQIAINPDAQALAVPTSSLIEFAGTEKVWKVVEGKTQEQLVRTGSRRGEWVEVIEGLAAGDWVIKQGTEGRIGRMDDATGKPSEAVRPVTFTARP